MIPVLNTAMCLMSCFVRVSETGAVEIAFGGGAAPGAVTQCTPTDTPCACVHSLGHLCAMSA